MIGLINKNHFDKFCDFSRQLLETNDIDPQYYVIKSVCDQRGYSLSKRYDFCVAFYGFNHVGSTDKYVLNSSIDVATLPYGKNRRGFRGNRKVLSFFQDSLEIKPIIMSLGGSNNSWDAIYEALLSVRGCGPWSAYCLTEVLNMALGWGGHASNFGEVESSHKKTGPLAALELLTDIPIEHFKKDKNLHRAVYQETLSRVNWAGMEQMESALCNYMSLTKNTYYVGRDIDRQIPALKDAAREWWEARKLLFPKESLGEFNDWNGPRKELMGKFEMGKRWVN